MLIAISGARFYSTTNPELNSEVQSRITKFYKMYIDTIHDVTDNFNEFSQSETNPEINVHVHSCRSSNRDECDIGVVHRQSNL